MPIPRKNPLIYEINTWVWLAELSARLQRPVTLDTVPEAIWDGIAEIGFDAVWLMGVWRRSPAGVAIAQRNADLQASFRQALSDFQEADNVGSPYCIREYRVDGQFGGPEALATARAQLAARGLSLLLDFVPNHVAPDHPWVFEHPDYFVRGSARNLQNEPGAYIEIAGRIFACGRDPYFPAWPDVLQLNAFHPGLRQAVIATLSEIAEQCDGVRCDMAMLLMNTIFQRTWGDRADAVPGEDYWPHVIAAVRQSHPDFQWIAEAYWDLEWDLQQQGFDYCYDKRLYDRLAHETAESVRDHLLADIGYQRKLVRFIENHDEPRAAAEFPGRREMACAVAFSTLPGARLFHEGQLEGRQVKLPVFLGRRLPESLDEEVQGFYRRLLQIVAAPAFRDGEWQLCECHGWPDNPSFLNIVAWCWRGAGERFVIVINLSPADAQARVQLPWADWPDGPYTLTDEFTGEVFRRSGWELHDPGLFVALAAWRFHCLRLAA